MIGSGDLSNREEKDKGRDQMKFILAILIPRPLSRRPWMCVVGLDDKAVLLIESQDHPNFDEMRVVSFVYDD